MSLRILKLSVAPALVSLFFFSTSVVPAVIVTADCTLLSWAFNSHGQSPCIIAAKMLSTCYAGSYTIAPLPPGYAYEGPNHENSNFCECSTVGYSLMSACVTCQERTPLTWTQYVTNCTSTLPPSQFPNPVPPDTFVPHWAILDVTNENIWNETESNAAGSSPEYGPGAIFGAEGVYTSSASTSSASTPSVSASSTALPIHSRSGSHAGPIAGGVVGGIAAISIAVAAIFYIWRRRQSRSQAEAPGAGAFEELVSDDGTNRAASSTLSSTVTPRQSSTVTRQPTMAMKLYDPGDPTTYPGYQGPQYLSQDVPAAYQLTLPPDVGSGGTLRLADMLPDDEGYRSLLPSA